MTLENEFTVAASLGDTWQTLLDIERVARCLPGATIEPGDAVAGVPAVESHGTTEEGTR